MVCNQFCYIENKNKLQKEKMPGLGVLRWVGHNKDNKLFVER